MPKADANQSNPPQGSKFEGGRLAGDEDLASRVSAYLDGELTGEALARFEALLQSDKALAREIAGLQRIGMELTKLGANILDEPIPEALLEPLARLKSEK